MTDNLIPFPAVAGYHVVKATPIHPALGNLPPDAIDEPTEREEEDARLTRQLEASMELVRQRATGALEKKGTPCGHCGVPIAKNVVTTAGVTRDLGWIHIDEQGYRFIHCKQAKAEPQA